MRKATKRIYMSILAVTLLFVTVVATTYAWVGILTYGQTDSFKLNLKTSDLENDFYLTISATDKDDYSEAADEYELKKQILTNKANIYFDDSSTTQYIDKEFYRNFQIHPTTTTMNTILNDEFHEINPLYGANSISTEWSKDFYKFDIYLSVEHREGDAAIKPDTNVQTDLILANIENTLTGDIATQALSNDFNFPSVEDLRTGVYNPNHFGEVKGVVNVNAASAARFALAIYDPISRNDSYSGTEEPSILRIYQGGTQVPTYDSTTDTYSFGGNLPEDFNLAIYEHKKNRNIKYDEFKIPDNVVNRGDLELVENNSKLFDDSFGFGVVNGDKKKIKVTVYFWFEGWDADCFEIIDAVMVRLNLEFASDSNVE